jgi:hypothetical protein
MISGRSKVPYYLILLLLSLLISRKLNAQAETDFERYSKKYPNNSTILTSLKQDLVIEMTDGKPVLKLNEYKEYQALNDNAIFFADSKEMFGSIFKFNNIEAYSLVPEKGGFKKILVTNFNKTTEASNSLFYDDIIDYNFTFPSVVKGVKMISKTQMSCEDPAFAHRFYFGSYFPGEEYVFTVTCPKNVEIKYKIFGRDTSIINFSFLMKGGNKVYTWRASNPKSYLNDKYAPDADYYLPHVIVQVSKYNYKGITTSINSSVNDLYKIVYKRISNLNLSVPGEIKSLTDSLTNGIVSNKEKVRKIYTWVQENIKYVAFEDGDNGFVPREAGLVMKRKFGDCKDKTSLLVTMLKSQGLNASYTWIGTRDIPYRFCDLATGLNFNHMIAVWWDDSNNPVILDGTAHHLAPGDIPSFIQGKECLIDKGPDSYRIYTIPVASPWKNTTYDSLCVEARGDTLVGDGISSVNGELRSYMLDRFEGKDLSDLPEIVAKLMPKASNKFIIKSIIPSAINESDTMLNYAYKFYLPDYLTSYNNVSYLNLNLDRFPEMSLQEDRWIPIELNNTKKHIFVCTFKIPEGYETRDIPKNSSYENELFGYNLSYKVDKREITIKTIVTLNFQVIENSEMARFREMLSQLNSCYIKSIPLYKSAKQ